MTQFLRDQANDSEEVVTPLMLDGTYLSRNFATLRTLDHSRHVFSILRSGCSMIQGSGSNLLVDESKPRPIPYQAVAL